ncbi:retrovirus-related pol polyprotein from transposon TNT 1-94 [Tanacetum coccineum]
MSVNHDKYTLVIVDEYSMYTWVYFLRKKSQAAKMIMSFIRMVENQNDVKVKQIETYNGTEFKNSELEIFGDEKGISHNFSSPYTPKQNGVAERKNRTLIEAAKTMINSSVMAISVISVSLDSSEDSVGTPAGRVILFGTISTTIPDTTPSVIPPTTHIDTTLIPIVSRTIPASPDYTPTSPDYSPAFDMEFDLSEDPSSDHIPPLPATLPFLSSTDDSSDIDIPDTPPSPTHGTPFTETTLSTQSSPVASGTLRRRVMVLAPG